jgi:hypothetical protein
MVLVISDNGRFNSKKKKGIGFKICSNKECHGEFQIKSKGEGYHHYHSNRTKLIPT